jgi:hypothetical protein
LLGPPTAQGAAARDWLADREAELLPVGYFHLVFTLPSEIADIAYQNKRVIYGLLFKDSAEATLTIAADPKHLGAKIGFTAVLHSSAMTHHPHTHMSATRPDWQYRLPKPPIRYKFHGLGPNLVETRTAIDC